MTVLAAQLTCSVFLFDYRKFSFKLPSQIRPLSLVTPPFFQGKKVNKAPSLPSPNYFSLLNDRLYQSITTVKLRMD